MLEKRKVILGLVILMIGVIIIGVSYALWKLVLTQTDSNTLLSDCFNVTLREDTERINLEKSYPITDEESKSLTPYIFTVTNACTSYAKYDIRIEIEDTTTLGLEYVKISLNNETPVLLSELVDTQEEKEGVSKILYIKTGYLDAEDEASYELRMWIDEAVSMEDPVANKTIQSKINIEASYINEAPSYCEMNPETGACTILAKGETDELKFDNTEDNNLRYIGANPNNYVSFNNELWRIIGVMNNIDDGTGTKETRLKIIRNEPYSESIAWDTDNVNDWSTASLQEELNGSYLENITSPSKEMIEDAVWKLGGSSSYDDVTASMFYERERGTEVPSGHAAEWTGKIGLMYPSDYGYATSGGETINRETCLNTALWSWSSSSDCKNNDWLYDGSIAHWTITSRSIYLNYVFIVYSDGSVANYIADNMVNAASPALYLTSNVKISGGEGTESSPYELSL